MLSFTAVLLALTALLYTLLVRERDLPEPEPVSPARHWEERRAAIYDNLRDLQFEYLVGKLSDQDYQQSKQDLQRELAAVNAEIARLSAAAPPAAAPAPPRAPAAPAPHKPAGAECPHCGARFPQPMRFCGECGKPMGRGEA